MFRSSNAKTNVPSQDQITTEPQNEPLNPAKIEPAKPGLERRKISLVLGGTGIASFATVGLLKRLHEEGIEFDSITTTGWPTLFVLASGFLRSIHDVEWFAMRLGEKDFYKMGIFDPNKGEPRLERLPGIIENNFKQREIEESKFPILVSASNTEVNDNDIYDRGDWRAPLLKTMSIPGIFRPYPHETHDSWIPSLHAINAELARKREGKIIVAVEMYEDYFDFLRSGKKDSSDGVFRHQYLSALKKSLSNELKSADVVGHIDLQIPPTNFSQRRLAIFAGYKEGARLAKIIRKLEIK